MKIFLYTFFIFQLVLTSVPGFSKEDAFIQKTINKTKRDVLTIGGLGLGGAALGLSTLAFVKEPLDNLKNIAIGGAVGIILGVGVVAYNHATEGNLYYESYNIDPKEFETGERISWHKRQIEENILVIKSDLPPLSYNFQF
ncbi:MAG: hypothetical protein DRQ88_04945 [Epsilonproteobacteria bacterium]|nr:MAG: hypothetical protein DRQ89_10740 [Campylobacterota bacterium]RLA66881.1 MAG: hypothetical protein DRQ88_04945 [Campylobacterota bacterium]